MRHKLMSGSGRVLTVALFSCVALFAQSSGEPPPAVSWSQSPRWGYDANVSRSGNLVLIHANGPRPMRDVVQALSRTHGWAIDYEDPVFQAGLDTRDATAPEWREKHPKERGLIGVRGGELLVSYDETLNPSGDPESPLSILKTFAEIYAHTDLPEGFRIEAEDSSHAAVVGTDPRSGTASAFLDTPVSLPVHAMSADEAIHEVLDAASDASGIPSVLSNHPFYFSTASVMPSGTSISARKQLRHILDAAGSSQYDWSLLFDPDTRTYHFNVAPLVREVTSPDGHMMLVRVPR